MACINHNLELVKYLYLKFPSVKEEKNKEGKKGLDQLDSYNKKVVERKIERYRRNNNILSI